MWSGLDPINPETLRMEIFLSICHPEAPVPYFGSRWHKALSDPPGVSVSASPPPPSWERKGTSLYCRIQKAWEAGSPASILAESSPDVF